MPHFFRVLAISALSACALTAHAEDLQCASGTLVEVSGQVTTLNISATRQAGQICMVLTDLASGMERFNSCGALVGKIVSSDPSMGTSVLTHTALFDQKNSFRTENDVAQITAPIDFDPVTAAPCAFSVTERITQIAWSKGVVQKGPVDIVAEGQISACPGKNLNSFILSGQACIHP